MRENEEQREENARLTGKNGGKVDDPSDIATATKKSSFFRPLVIALTLFISVFYGIYELTANADLWLQIPKTADVHVTKLVINNDIVFDEGKNVRESRFFGVNPSNGKNILKIYLLSDESGVVEERSCIFNRSAHSCLMEVFVSEKNFSCGDCDHLK